jgi:hypothetical protein
MSGCARGSYCKVPLMPKLTQTEAEVGSDNESEEDNNILCPTKPSHIEFGKIHSKCRRPGCDEEARLFRRK